LPRAVRLDGGLFGVQLLGLDAARRSRDALKPNQALQEALKRTG